MLQWKTKTKQSRNVISICFANVSQKSSQKERTGHAKYLYHISVRS